MHFKGVCTLPARGSHVKVKRQIAALVHALAYAVHEYFALFVHGFEMQQNFTPAGKIEGSPVYQNFVPVQNSAHAACVALRAKRHQNFAVGLIHPAALSDVLACGYYRVIPTAVENIEIAPFHLGARIFRTRLFRNFEIAVFIARPQLFPARPFAASIVVARGRRLFAKGIFIDYIC